MTDSPHFWWIIGVLSAVILILFSILLTGNVICGDVVMTFIGYASTILSIALSVFAIAYTYISNENMRSQLDRMSETNREMGRTAESIGNASSKMEDSTRVVLGKLDDILEMQHNLSNTMGNPSMANKSGRQSNIKKKSNNKSPRNTQKES